MRILQCKLTTIEAMLGTASNNKELHSKFIAKHAPDAPSREEEIEAVGVEEVIEKGMTVFSRNKDGQPILWDYQIKGFFKDACGVLRKVKGTKSSKIKAYKKEFHCAEILIGATGNTPITMKIQPKAVGNSGQEKGRNDPPGRE